METSRGRRRSNLVGDVVGASLSRGDLAFWLLTGLSAATMLATLMLAIAGTDVAQPDVAALFYSYAAAMPLVVAIYWRQRRPASRTSWLLAMLGLSWALIGWQLSASPWLYAIGVAAEGPAVLITFGLIATYPRGRFDTRWSALLIGCLAAGLAISYVPWLVSSPSITGDIPVFSCQANCPVNPLYLVSLPVDAQSLLATITYAGIGLIAVGLVTDFIIRFRRRRRFSQRSAMGLGHTSGIFLLIVVAFVVGSLVLAPADPTRQTSSVLLLVALLLFPVGFAVPLVLAELNASTILRSLTAEVAGGFSHSAWRDRLAALLGDPTLQLGYFDAGSGRLVEADGHELSPPTGGDRRWIPISSGELVLAALSIDATLDPEPEPELIQAIVEATGLAAGSQRALVAQSELEWHAARAADHERMRMAREIQAKTQQRLAALRVQLALALQREHGPDAGMLTDVDQGLDLAIRELHDVVSSSEPPVVTEIGVGRALRAATHDLPIPVRVSDRGLRRHPTNVEVAVYYSCLEAIQNAVKHAGSGASVTVRLSNVYPDGIRFSVTDTGRGFDTSARHSGSGLRNIRERVLGLGGEINIASRPGWGTSVSGSIGSLRGAQVAKPELGSEHLPC